MNQKLAILRALAKGESLTVAKALSELNVYALSQRCGELRKDGWPVESRMIEVESGTVHIPLSGFLFEGRRIP